MDAKTLILLLLLAGCSTVPAPVEDPRAVWCEQNEPLRLPAVAIAMLSRSDKEQILTHNEKGAAWCGWSP